MPKALSPLFIMSVIGPLTVLSAIDHPSYAKEATPKLKVVLPNWGSSDGMIEITSLDDRTITLKRIVVNRKEGNEDCDFKEWGGKLSGAPATLTAVYPTPATIKFSERTTVTYSRIHCNNPMTIKIYTNVGSAIYNF